MTRADVLDMNKIEREWHVERIVKQYKAMHGAK